MGIHKIAILLGITLCVATAYADRCKQVKNKPCSDSDVEVYNEVFEKPKKHTMRTCCTADSASLESEQKYAASCRPTQCVEPTKGEMCNKYIHKRFLPGSKTPLDYEEIMRDTCKKTDGSSGATALCCVRGSPEAQLVTGRGAELNEFPHQALLLPVSCGGTIYNKRWVITAAHCLVTKGHVDPWSDTKVLLGTNNGEIRETGDSEESVYTYNVKRVIVHEYYTHLANHTLYKEKGAEGTILLNDIALLELDRDIQFNDNVKSLEIAPEGFDPFKYADKLVKIGWGTDATGKISSHLHKVNLPIRTDEECSTVWGQNIENHEDELICMGGVMNGVWSSTAGGGDSGGPAICRKANGNPVLCGVTSYGGESDELCTEYADEEHCEPSVYAEVSFYRDWIKGYAGEQDPSTFYKPILYGKKVKKGEAEHQVHITSADGKPCGGTLIAPDLVLTAQQCVMQPDGTGYHDVEVDARTNSLSGSGQTLGVAGVIPMEGFKMVGKPVASRDQGNRVIITDNYFKHDLALLKLDGKVKGVKKFPELPKDGTVFENGVEFAFPRDTKYGDQMRSREFRILDHGDCQRRMNRLEKTEVGKIKVDEMLLCGVEKYSGASECNRELGGGLICKGKNGKDVLCGVQVFRLCELSIPNGFINLAYEGMHAWVKAAKKDAAGF